MKKYLYWISVVAIVGLGLYFAMSVSVHPETQTILKWSQFSTPEEFGKSVFEQVRADVKKSPVLFLGVTPNKIEDMELWRGFLEANQEPGSKYDVVVVEPMLPYVELFASNMRIDIKEDMSRFVEGVQKARSEGLRVVVIVPNIYSSQLLKKNPVNRLKEDYKMEALSLSATKFPVTREQEESFDPKCVMEEGKDLTGTGPLGCVILNLARRTYRFKMEDNKYSGLMEKLSPADYLILLNRNAGSK